MCYSCIVPGYVMMHIYMCYSLLMMMYACIYEMMKFCRICDDAYMCYSCIVQEMKSIFCRNVDSFPFRKILALLVLFVGRSRRIFFMKTDGFTCLVVLYHVQAIWHPTV